MDKSKEQATSRDTGTYPWLPIGSVVTLKGARHELMIYGRRQKALHPTSDDGAGDSQEEWNYIACPWPEGNIGPDTTVLFDADRIETVWFIDYQNPDEFRFRRRLGPLVINEHKSAGTSPDEEETK